MVFVDLLSGCGPTEGDGRPVGSGMLSIDHRTFGKHLNPEWFGLLGAHCWLVAM